jgi:hypothetical protein
MKKFLAKVKEALTRKKKKLDLGFVSLTEKSQEDSDAEKMLKEHYSCNTCDCDCDYNNE